MLRFRVHLLIISMVSAILFGMAGCGGGGGGGTPKVVYSTDWTASDGGTITGQSQRAAIFTTNNVQVTSAILNRPGAVTQEHTFTLPSGGAYKLVVDLYSLPDLGGSHVGTLEALLSVNGTITFRSSVGTPPTSIKVSPPSASFQVQTSKQFYATAYSSANVATFVAPFSMDWSQFGGHISVNNTGLALGLSTGTGSVRATHLDSGLLNSATYNVQPFNATTTKWTVLVYMNAANDLYPYSTLNVNQMETVAQNSNVRFVVQWKQSQNLFPGSSFNGTRRYLVTPDLNSAIASTLIQDMGAGVDMGQHSTLLDFINWTKTFYPAQRYCLVVWNHGNGWRRRPGTDAWITRSVSSDDETGNAIQIWELAQALGSNHFDILAWDASLMQMLEVAYEVENQADYVVGSEESPPGEGYPYDLVFGQFRDNPDETSRNLSKSFVDGMLAVPSYQTRKITESVIDTTKLDDLANAVSGLGVALSAHGPSLSTLVNNVRNQSQSYLPTETRVYRDLIDICDRMDGLTGFSDVETAIDQTRAAALAALVWEGHNSNSPGSRGISIDFSSGTTFSASASDYALLKFGQLTQWDEWLSAAP